jgi:hypothetical protein
VQTLRLGVKAARRTYITAKRAHAAAILQYDQCVYEGRRLWRIELATRVRWRSGERTAWADGRTTWTDSETTRAVDEQAVRVRAGGRQRQRRFT